MDRMDWMVDLGVKSWNKIVDDEEEKVSRAVRFLCLISRTG